jgi:hypothetical protein
MIELDLLTHTISLDEYKAYFGVDLEFERGTKAKALVLLNQAKDDLDLFISDNLRLNLRERFNEMSNLQKEYYKKALLNQVKFRLELGDIGINDGLNESNTKTLTVEQRFLATISPIAIKYLKNSGLTMPYASGSGKRGIFPYGW